MPTVYKIIIIIIRVMFFRQVLDGMVILGTLEHSTNLTVKLTEYVIARLA